MTEPAESENNRKPAVYTNKTKQLNNSFFKKRFLFSEQSSCLSQRENEAKSAPPCGAPGKTFQWLKDLQLGLMSHLKLILFECYSGTLVDCPNPRAREMLY
ncbi:hypothetical protein TNIN_468841 [Trichonephila inaurata madagascariensis]|uniref:Uncharacterized protein n=1 Tax=Trichonephila inaurata madagascariensis TaxID=2747483 RepID=A0A8X7CT68_9ARAC|nr:hypothetical protein TNIN_468841 [Trichonephila inaurata madagascariensis]